MSTLYLTDLDGTLLDRQSRIPEESVRTLNALVEKGLLLSVATARSWTSAEKVIRQLDLRAPLILYNGACLFDVREKKRIWSVGFSLEEKRELAALFERLALSPMVYALQEGRETVSWRRDLENTGVRAYLAKRPGDPRLRPLGPEDGEKLHKGDVFYFSCIGERGRLQPLYEAVKDDERFFCIFHRELYQDDYWCEIMPAEASKAKAALRLKKMLGCERMVCFGDAINDLPLFKVCDEAYAVENAVEELKRAATGVIPSNERGGVARFLAERFAREESRS